MGASEWRYFVPFQEDLERVLEDLRRQVVASGDFYWPYRESPDDPLPSTLDEIFSEPEVAESGTHSILDISHVIAPEAEDDFGSLRQLTAAQTVALVEAARPTRADFDRSRSLWDESIRWSGYAVALHDGAGVPVEIAVWGYSGD